MKKARSKFQLYNGHQTADWFKVNDSEDIRSEILEWKNGRTNWDIWMPGDVQNNEKSYLVVRYIPICRGICW